MNLLTLDRALLRTGEQFNDSILRYSGAPGSGVEQLRQRESARVIYLTCRSNFGERLDDTLPGFVQLQGWNLTLASQYLPDSDIRLDETKGIASHRFGNLPQTFGKFQEEHNGGVTQLRKFSEDPVLVAVLSELQGHQTDRFRRQSIAGRPSAVEFAQSQVSLQRLAIDIFARDSEQTFH